tara:strand:+ start:29985 stop:30254 length:270 start_codon:yes stop_codon:yes gene_type:complete
MKIDQILLPKEIENDPEGFADQAFSLVESASSNFTSQDQVKHFLENHIELEMQQANIFQEFEGVPYHSNMSKSARSRLAAFQLMLNRLV